MCVVSFPPVGAHEFAENQSVPWKVMRGCHDSHPLFLALSVFYGILAVTGSKRKKKLKSGAVFSKLEGLTASQLCILCHKLTLH